MGVADNEHEDLWGRGKSESAVHCRKGCTLKWNSRLTLPGTLRTPKKAATDFSRQSAPGYSGRNSLGMSRTVVLR